MERVAAYYAGEFPQREREYVAVMRRLAEHSSAARVAAGLDAVPLNCFGFGLFPRGRVAAPTEPSRYSGSKESPMRWSIGLLLFAVGLSSVCADDQPEWKEFAAKEGRFKVLMPGTPKQDKAETESDFGKGVLHMNTVQADKTMYGANYCDFPAEIKKVPLKQVFDSSRDGAVANLEGKVASEKDIKLGDYPGREIRIDVASGKRLFRARVYLVGQRLYQVVVFGSQEAATSKEADKSLDSFKLVEK